MSQPVFARDQLRAFVERIEKLEEEVKQINDDKRDVYGEAKANGFDVKALKAVISYRRKDAAEREEQDAIFRLYLDTLQGKSDTGTPVATRARAQEPQPAPSNVSALPVSGPERLRAELTASKRMLEEFPDIPGHLDRRRPQ